MSRIWQYRPSVLLRRWISRILQFCDGNHEFLVHTAWYFFCGFYRVHGDIWILLHSVCWTLECTKLLFSFELPAPSELANPLVFAEESLFLVSTTSSTMKCQLNFQVHKNLLMDPNGNRVGGPSVRLCKNTFFLYLTTASVTSIGFERIVSFRLDETAPTLKISSFYFFRSFNAVF